MSSPIPISVLPSDIQKQKRQIKKAAENMSQTPTDATVEVAIKKLEDDIKHRPTKKLESILTRIWKYFYIPKYAVRIFVSVEIAKLLFELAMRLDTEIYAYNVSELNILKRDEKWARRYAVLSVPVLTLYIGLVAARTVQVSKAVRSFLTRARHSRHSPQVTSLRGSAR